MSFETRYNNLNDKQKLAVDTIYWPVLVIAGPGSGKTELLSVRIANILKQTDANANNILCITFTDNAAKNMRDRLKKIIWSEAYKVAIHTFHSFGTEIINKYKYKLGETADFTPIDDITKSKIFNEILGELSFDHPWKNEKIFAISTSIEQLKKANINYEDLEKIIEINEQLLNDIWPFFLEKFSEILELNPRSKEWKSQRAIFFEKLVNEIIPQMEKFPKKYKNQETLVSTMIKSFQEILLNAETDAEISKNITAWKGNFLEKDYNWKLNFKDISKNKKAKWLAKIYQKYSEELKKWWFIDFSDMILRANEILKNDEFARLNTAEQYQWILIDEYQDTNEAQLELITQIADVSDSPNIFAVGDDNQSIYKFQWANTKNIAEFKAKYRETELIILDTNYRSNKEIIDFSRKVISDPNSIGKIFEWAQKNFLSNRWEWWKIEIINFDNEIEEISYISDKIKEIIKEEKSRDKNFSLNEIAIIGRNNKILEYYGKLLLSKKIPVQLSRDENIFDNTVVNLLKNILIFIHSISQNEDNEELLVEILNHEVWWINRLDLWKISRKIYLAKNPENKIWIENLLNSENKKISNIAKFLIDLSIKSREMRLEDMIDIIIGSDKYEIPDDYNDENPDKDQMRIGLEDDENIFISPIFETYFSEKILREKPLNYAFHLSNIRKIIESIREYKKNNSKLLLKDFIEYINLVEKYEIKLWTSSIIGTPDSVQCITAHKSKWLEYKYVFAIGLTEKNYSNKKNESNPFPSNFALRAEKDDTEDIERLIYTIFTRAKDNLFLSYSNKDIDEKSTSAVSVLWFIENWSKNEQKSIDNCSKILKEERKNFIELDFTGEEKEFLKNIIDSNFKFSATSIQNFLDITKWWPEYFISKNIIQFPQAKSIYSTYGTAIHKALEDFMADYKIKKSFNKAILLKSFIETLQKEWFDEKTEKEWIEKWVDNLESLYPELINEYKEFWTEERFNSTYLDEIKITGAIDKIEATSDMKLLITDYKTGWNFKNLDDITKWISDYEKVKKWKYNLQLIFYAILFEETPRWSPWQTREFELFFVEKDKKTKEFIKIKKYVQRWEIDRLKKLVKIIAEKVKNLDFPNTSKYSQDIKWILEFEEDLLNWNI